MTLELPKTGKISFSFSESKSFHWIYIKLGAHYLGQVQLQIKFLPPSLHTL